MDLCGFQLGNQNIQITPFWVDSFNWVDVKARVCQYGGLFVFHPFRHFPLLRWQSTFLWQDLSLTGHLAKSGQDSFCAELPRLGSSPLIQHHNLLSLQLEQERDPDICSHKFQLVFPFNLFCQSFCGLPEIDKQWIAWYLHFWVFCTWWSWCTWCTLMYLLSPNVYLAPGGLGRQRTGPAAGGWGHMWSPPLPAFAWCFFHMSYVIYMCFWIWTLVLFH